MNFKQEFIELFRVKPSGQTWHIPLLAALSVGVPLLLGWYFEDLKQGLYAALGGLVILYFPTKAHVASGMITLLSASFGFILSFAVGLIVSFSFYPGITLFGLFCMAAHWVTLYFKTEAPRSFFFLMIGSMAVSFPHDLSLVPERVGLIALGTMWASGLALLFGLFFITRNPKNDDWSITAIIQRNRSVQWGEPIVVGVLMFTSLLIGHLLHFKNPYWIAISCAAIIQGASAYQINQRMIQRIFGTFVGLGLCWLILNMTTTPLQICLTIMGLQFIIEVLVSRQYALAVMFITPMTILMADIANLGHLQPNELMLLRLYEISAGSLLGAIGGTFLYGRTKLNE